MSEPPEDIRASVAQYYDLNPLVPDDVAFYAALVPSADASVLELGCGTGRVLAPLAEGCGSILGIDGSPAMLAICRDKLRQAELPASRADTCLADITDFRVGRKFDLVIAPYRVLQNLESDSQVEGLFRCIDAHLAPGGSCVLNVFMPNRDAAELRRSWITPGETFQWRVAVPGGHVTCHDRRTHIDAQRLILYPELVYRRYQGQTLVDEAVLRIPMRCYYPDELLDLVARHGFRILNRWGGYAGEAYGKGPELVVHFDRTAQRSA